MDSVTPFLRSKGLPAVSHAFKAFRRYAGASCFDMVALHEVSKATFSIYISDLTNAMLRAPNLQMRRTRRGASGLWQAFKNGATTL